MSGERMYEQLVDFEFTANFVDEDGTKRRVVGKLIGDQDSTVTIEWDAEEVEDTKVHDLIRLWRATGRMDITIKLEKVRLNDDHDNA